MLLGPWARMVNHQRTALHQGSIAAMNVAFLNLRKVIISRSYLPLSQLDSRRGFWQDIGPSRSDDISTASRVLLLERATFKSAIKYNISIRNQYLLP